VTRTFDLSSLASRSKPLWCVVRGDKLRARRVESLRLQQDLEDRAVHVAADRKAPQSEESRGDVGDISNQWQIGPGQLADSDTLDVRTGGPAAIITPGGPLPCPPDSFSGRPSEFRLKRASRCFACIP